MSSEKSGIQLARADIERCFEQKYEDLSKTGWGPRLRKRFGYYTPDDVYEAMVDRLVEPETDWVDVGCGRFVFPSNPKLARVLADRCHHLVGVDPDPTLEENEFVHEKALMLIDDYETDREFDLVTLRMVAEHIEDPEAAVKSLARLTKPGGRVVIYTVFKWSPVPLVTDLVPFGLHHPVKKLLWGSEEKDTFPVANKMNTRGDLKKVFETAEFKEIHFSYLDDCRTTGNIWVLQCLELFTCRVLNAIGLHYPEVCILGVYEHRPG